MSGEATTRFACFGGTCAVLVTSDGPAGRAPAAVARGRRRLEAWHDQFSRFEAGSELSRLNRDPRWTVPASAVMIRLAEAAVRAAHDTGGLVDPTLVDELEAAGYAGSLCRPGAPAPLPLVEALAAAPPRAPAQPDPDERWRQVAVDARARTIIRPPGVRLDGGGIAKGLFADILATALAGHDSFAVDAAGDVRLGGRGGVPRAVRVAGPCAGDEVLHTFHLRRGAAATSGIARRMWRVAPESAVDGRGAPWAQPPRARPPLALPPRARPPQPGHHLLDPSTGRPAFTGLVQVTALAATGVVAEARAKAALLSGPGRAAGWLPDGGVIVAEDGAVTVLDASLALSGDRRATARRCDPRATAA